MKIKSEIEELNAKFDHLQDRVDNLRDYLKEQPHVYAIGYWDQFNDLLAWSLKFDKNSKEYKILVKASFELLDRYLKITYKPQG